MSKKSLACAPVLMLVIAALAGLVQFARSQDNYLQRYDWIIEAQMQELKGYVIYAGSTVRPIIKASITYKNTDAPSGSKPVKYEDLYFKGYEAIGCRRYHTLDLESGDGVAIRIKSKSQNVTLEQSSAAANAIVRLLLDSYLNGNSVVAVLLPRSSFERVVQNLQRANFYSAPPSSPDEPVDTAIILHLISEPPGSSQTMYYNGSTE